MSGIVPSFVRGTTSEEPSICGVTSTKHSRLVSQRTSGNKVLRLGKTRTLRRKCFARCVIVANFFAHSSLEPGVKERYLHVYNIVLDRLPWLRMSLNDFIKDGSTLDFAILVRFCGTVCFF